MYEANANADVSGTSFNGTAIKASPFELIEVLGDAHHSSIDGKVNLEWLFENEDGEIFTLYDWREGELDALKPIEFHVGSRGGEEDAFKTWLEAQLSA